MKVKAIRFHAPGEPGVLQLDELDLPDPGAGEVRIHHTAIGLNFQDIYARSGQYPVPTPSGLGTEAVGVVDAQADHRAAGDAHDRGDQGEDPDLRIAELAGAQDLADADSDDAPPRPS